MATIRKDNTLRQPFNASTNFNYALFVSRTLYTSVNYTSPEGNLEPKYRSGYSAHTCLYVHATTSIQALYTTV